MLRKFLSPFAILLTLLLLSSCGGTPRGYTNPGEEAAYQRGLAHAKQRQQFLLEERAFERGLSAGGWGRGRY